MKIDPSGQPMMSEEEIEHVKRILAERDPAYVLEWGSGNSSLYFPEHSTHVEWTAVEHNGNYIKHLVEKGPTERVTFIWAPEDAFYVDCVKLNKDHYDIVIVDGLDQWREKCLEAAMYVLKPGGIALLHDSGRKEYHDWIKKYPDREMLTVGELPQGEGFFAHRGLTAFHKKK